MNQAELNRILNNLTPRSRGSALSTLRPMAAARPGTVYTVSECASLCYNRDRDKKWFDGSLGRSIRRKMYGEDQKAILKGISRAWDGRVFNDQLDDHERARAHLANRLIQAVNALPSKQGESGKPLSRDSLRRINVNLPTKRLFDLIQALERGEKHVLADEIRAADPVAVRQQFTVALAALAAKR